jgi:hypothetical protein
VGNFARSKPSAQSHNLDHYSLDTQHRFTDTERQRSYDNSGFRGKVCFALVVE